MSRYAQVIPLTRLPKGLDYFDYAVVDDITLAPGDAVEIPWRSKTITGIVWRLSDTTTAPLDKIKAIVRRRTDWRLTTSQLFLLNLLHDQFGTSAGVVARMCIPPGKRLPPVTATWQLPLPSDHPLHNHTQPHVAWIWQHDQLRKYQYAMQYALEKTAHGGQVLILVSEARLAEEIAGMWRQHCGAAVGVLAGPAATSTDNLLWHQVAAGLPIVIGTRRALFLPWQRLAGIMVDQPHHRSYHQWDQDPRYHAVAVAKSLATELHAQYVENVPVLSVSAYAGYKQKTITVAASRQSVPTSIVSLQAEHEGGNYHVLGESTQQLITETLEQNQQVIIFHNRRGYARSIRCRDCDHEWVCPTCTVPLAEHLHPQPHLQCHICDHQEPRPLACPDCRGVHIKTSGTGAQRVESDLKKMWPQATIDRLDREQKDQASTWGSFTSKKTHILITTESIFNHYLPEPVGLVVITRFDQLTTGADYDTNERAWMLLHAAKCLAKSHFVIQSTNTDQPLLQAIDNPQSFYDQELAARERLHFPPFGQVVRLISKKNTSLTKAQVESFAATLSIHGFPNYPPLFDPHDQRWIITIKTTQKIPHELLGVSDWLVDYDTGF